MILDIINRGDLCPLVGVILILFILGRLIASDRQKMWGIVIGVIAFLGYGGYALSEFPPRSADDVLMVSLRALIVFGLVVPLSWLILALVVGLVSFLWDKIRASKDGSATKRSKLEDEENEMRRRAFQEEQDRQAAYDLALKTQEEAAAKAEAQKTQKRKDDARTGVVFVYEQQGQTIAQRLPRQRFDELMKQLMGDDTRPPEEIEQRAIQILNLIYGFVQELTPKPASGPNADVITARAEAERFYGERPEVHAACPPRRFQAEIRVRIPDHATAEEAWKEARDMMKEILDLSMQEKQKNAQQPAFNPPLTNI